MKAKTTNRGKSTRQTTSGAPARAPSERPTGSEPAPTASAAGRRGGPRGSAPWTTRHAAKHAAEAAARNATPPAPGSARATLRTPAGAEELKALLTELTSAIGRLRGYKRNLNRDFWEAGLVLRELRERRLFEAKGYSSFDAFVERELDFGRATAQRLSQLPRVFLPEAAQELGLPVLLAIMELIEGDRESQTRLAVAVAPSKPLKPPAASRP